MKYRFHCHPVNLINRLPLRENSVMMYHTTALRPISCSPVVNDPYQNPEGRPYPTQEYHTHTALSCIYNSWRSLSPPKKLTSSTANLEWCHVHFIRDSYSTFIRRVIGPSKNSMELFFNAKFDFKSTWNRHWTTSHHKHPVCQSPTGDAEKKKQCLVKVFWNESDYWQLAPVSWDNMT